MKASSCNKRSRSSLAALCLPLLMLSGCGSGGGANSGRNAGNAGGSPPAPPAAPTRAALHPVSRQAATSIHSFSAGAQPGWQMVSSPFVLGQSFSDLGIYAARLDPTTNSYTIVPAPPADRFMPGMGYWIYVTSKIDLPGPGTPVDATKPFTMALKAGWNQVGDPFTSPVALSGLTIGAGGSSTLSSAMAAGQVSPLYQYDSTAKTYLPLSDSSQLMAPWVGYWLYSRTDLSLVVTPPSGGAPVPGGTAPAAAGHTLPAVDSSTPVSSREQNAVSSDNQFGFNLFSQLRSGSSGQNVFYSPFSVAMAMDLVYNGAGGTTQQAMAQALGLGTTSLADTNAANATLLGRLQNPDPQVQLNIANALWSQAGATLSPDFLQRDEQFYGARAGILDFGDPGSVDVINSWVNQQTNGKIPTVLSHGDLDSGTRIVLANAVYFKAPWTRPFEPGATQDAPFTLGSGGTRSVPMMSHVSGYPYLETADFQAISLPYAEGRLSMLVFLPTSSSSLDKLLGSLNAESLQAWASQLQYQEVILKLPRFKVNYGADLIPGLKALGMGIAFTPGAADFTSMGLPDTYITVVKHAAFLSVDEQGTEAAAATGVGAEATGPIGSIGPPKQMIVNHPFFCAIRDSQTGAILFMGAITDPQS